MQNNFNSDSDTIQISKKALSDVFCHNNAKHEQKLHENIRLKAGKIISDKKIQALREKNEALERENEILRVKAASKASLKDKSSIEHLQFIQVSRAQIEKLEKNEDILIQQEVEKQKPALIQFGKDNNLKIDI